MQERTNDENASRGRRSHAQVGQLPIACAKSCQVSKKDPSVETPDGATRSVRGAACEGHARRPCTAHAPANEAHAARGGAARGTCSRAGRWRRRWRSQRAAGLWSSRAACSSGRYRNWSLLLSAQLLDYKTLHWPRDPRGRPTDSSRPGPRGPLGRPRGRPRGRRRSTASCCAAVRPVRSG